MTTRRTGRTSHVRPRAPSNGRPAASRPRPRPPVTSRLAAPRRETRRPALPIAMRVVLVGAIVVLGAAVFSTATGGLGRVASLLGASVGGFIDDISATPSPSPTEVIVSDSPFIAGPTNGEPYTNVATVDLVLTIPADVVGRADTTVRIYVAIGEQAPAPISELPVGDTTQLIVPVQLSEGSNHFTATLVEPAGESEPSPIVTWILDTAPPQIVLSSPASGATVNGQAVQLVGTTQPRSALVARNEANNASATGIAEADGSFSLTLPIQPGTNGIALSATDPAGNAASSVVSILRGSGQLTAVLTASTFQVSIGQLPVELELSAVVTDPDGRPLEGSAVTFTLSIPGIQVVTSDATTGGDGRAVFRTTIPPGATAGSGLGTILVTTTEFGTTSDRTVINVVP